MPQVRALPLGPKGALQNQCHQVNVTERSGKRKDLHRTAYPGVNAERETLGKDPVQDDRNDDNTSSGGGTDCKNSSYNRSEQMNRIKLQEKNLGAFSNLRQNYVFSHNTRYNIPLF